MPIPLINTKTFAPIADQEFIHRFRLFEKIDQYQSKSITVVCAPAGFGKTTLVSDWIHFQKIPATWLSLDKNDNDLLRFFLYIYHALQKTDPDIGEEIVTKIQSNERINAETIASNLINDISDSRHPFVLVLDDFHLIESAGIHQALVLLLDNSPPNIHIILTTRSEPPLMISKRRARNQIIEIGASDLRFNPNEASEYLNQTKKINLSDHDIQTLNQRTEGWIVGLQLAVLSLTDQNHHSEFIRKFSGMHRFVTDYLIDEVLNHQSEEIQQFLLKTSILNQMCADACNALLENENSQETIEQLEKSNLFIIKLDHTRTWYRYHHLFSDLLRSRLKRANLDLNSLYLKAYVWHLQQGLTEEAIFYGLKGKYFEVVADLIEEKAFHFYWSNNVKIVQEWLVAIPENFTASRPHLQILKAYLEINSGKLRAADQTFSAVRNQINNCSDIESETCQVIKGRAASGLTAISYHYHMKWLDTLDHAKTTLRLLPKDYLFDRCVASFHGGGALIALGDLEQASDYLNNAKTLSDLSRYPFARFLIQSYLGDLKYNRGQLKQAQLIYKEVFELASEIDGHGTKSPSSGSVIGLAKVHYEWNQLNESLKYLEKLVSITEKEEFIDQMMLSHSTMIKLQCTLENFDEAQEYLRRIVFSAENYGVSETIFCRIDFLKIETDLASGNIEKASYRIKKYYQGASQNVSCEKETELLTYTRCLIAQNQVKQAKDTLILLLDLANNQGRINSVIKLGTVIAKCNYLQKDTLKGMDYLLNALELAESEGFIRIFIDEGEPIRNLLSKLLKTNDVKLKSRISQDYVQTLLNHFAQGQFSEAPTNRLKRQLSSVDDHLTPRETDVIRLLAKGMQYSEIADRLEISENTLKYHIKNIYSKLQVNNRMQAVTAAQELSII